MKNIITLILIIGLHVFTLGLVALPVFGQQIKLNSGAYLKNNGANIIVNGKIDNSGSITNSEIAGFNVSGDLQNSGTFAAGPATHQIRGNFSNNGIFTGSESTVTCNGTSAQAIGGTSATTFNNLTIDNTAGVILTNVALTTVSGALTINIGKKFELASGKQLTVSGSLTNSAGNDGLRIKSDATGTGSLICSTTDVEARVERFLTHSKWHFIGIPVESGVAGVFHLPSGHSDIWLRTHVESTNTWTDDIVPMETPLIQGRGYECWVGDPLGFSQDETVVFPGNLNAGNYTTGSGSFYALEYTAGHGLNLICNPYPSALEANISSWNKTNIANKVWTWSPVYGNYVFWGSGDDYGSGAFGTMTGGVIPEMQAFFVEATGTSPVLTIPQTDRIHSSQAYYKDSDLPLNTLQLDVTGNEYYDAMFVNFKEQATEEYDVNYDVEKIFGLDEAPQIYAVIIGKQLSINSLPNIGVDRIVNIGFECSVNTTFNINVSGMEGFDADTEFYLEDLKEGIVQNLKDNPQYNFTSEVSNDPSRFLLHFGNPSAIEETVTEFVKIYSYNDVIHILNPTQGKMNIYVCDILGRKIIEKEDCASGVIKLQPEVERGYYIVKVQSGNQVTQKKVFLQ